MKTLNKSALAFTTSVLALSIAVSATAQQNDEVIVTATKRAENIQDVPISISAYGADFIEESGVADLRDIALYSPNFTIGSSSQLSNSRIAIRGVGSVGNAAIEPSVGVFIDGVYYPRPGSVIGNLMDIQAVEVLRGPQGTLFGRNTPMGALSVRTKDPSFGGVEGEAVIGYGNYNAFNVGGAVNLPLGENVAARISGKYTDRDGYGTNLLTGEDFGGRDNLSLRGKLLFAPTDAFSLKLTADYSKINSTGATIEYLNDAHSPVLTGTLGALLPLDPTLSGINTGNLVTDDPYDHEVYQVHDDNLDDKQWGLSGEMTYEMDNGVELKSITAVRNWKAKYYESAIRLPVSLFPRLTDYNNDTFSQEFQILSPTGGKVDWLAGLFYYQEKYDISQDFDLGSEFCTPIVQGVIFQQLVPAALAGVGPFAALGPAPSLAVAQQRAGAAAAAQGAACDAGDQTRASDSEFQQDLKSYAIFGQGTYHASDELSFTLGGRYTIDEKEADFVNLITNPFVDQVLGVRDAENHLGLNIKEFGYDNKAFTYFANVSFDVTPDTMLFATTSSGYKSGGFNSDGVGGGGLTRAERIFGPEDTTNYEAGVKTTLMDGALQLNLTAFRMDIDGFQDRTFDGISFITRNVGSLRQQGIEGDATWSPMDQLKFIGGFSYLDSEFTDYRNASGLPGQPNQDLTGQRAHFAPKWQYSLVADWEDNLSDSMMYFLRGETQHVGTQNIGANTNQNPQSTQESYSIFNARVGIRDADNRWDLSVWGKNLTDKGYCMTIFDQPFAANLGAVDATAGTSPQRCAVGNPLTFGAELKVRY